MEDIIKAYLTGLSIDPDRRYAVDLLKKVISDELFGKLQPLLDLGVLINPWWTVHIRLLPNYIPSTVYKGSWFEVVVDYGKDDTGGKAHVYRLKRTVSGEVINELDPTPSFSVVKGVLF